MFDDKNENENWDNIELDDINTSSGEPSWDDILDNAVVHDEQDDYDSNNVNQGSNNSYYGQNAQTSNYDYNQTYDVVEDSEPFVETSTQSRETNNVSEVYTQDDMQQEVSDDYSSFEAGVYNEQQAQSAGDDQYYSDDSSKPIGIKQDQKFPMPAILGIIVAIIFAILFYLGYSYLKENNMIPSNNSQTTSQDEFQNQGDEDLFGDVNSNQNNNVNNTATGFEDQPQASSADKVVVNVVNGGRSNPFTPTGNFSEAGYTIPKGLDIMGPPSYDKETTPNQLVDIVVSGILYDNSKPSAIITIGGIDHFVQRGDSIDEYVVSYIGPNSVTIRSGRNTYRASIGQQFNVNDRIQGETTYVKGKNGVTRQYFTPSSDDIENE